MQLKNKVAIIIGLDAIGIEVAKGLLKEGANLTVADKDQEKIDIITDYAKSIEKETLGIICDPTQEDQVKSVIEKTLDYGNIDILITNFYWNKLVPFINVDEKLWDEILDKNLKAAFYCVRSVIPEMKKAKNGKIIHILSLSGCAGSINEVPLSTASASLMGFTKAVAKEVGKNKIRVNAVAVPFINAESFPEIYSEDEIEKLKKLIPLDKLCTPEDVVGPVIFLASNKSNHITGEVIIVSGGSYMH